MFLNVVSSVIPMHKRLPCYLSLWITVLGSGFLLRTSHAQENLSSLSCETRLRFAVQSYLQGAPLRNYESTPYLFAFVELAGTGKRQAIIYLTGREWCGTGGCTMLVLTQQDSSYRVLGRIPTVKLPIRLLESRSHGWRDLAVFTQGGGILVGHQERVRFDGDMYYRESPEVGEEGHVQRVEGAIILSRKDKAVQLYP